MPLKYKSAAAQRRTMKIQTEAKTKQSNNLKNIGNRLIIIYL